MYNNKLKVNVFNLASQLKVVVLLIGDQLYKIIIFFKSINR